MSTSTQTKRERQEVRRAERLAAESARRRRDGRRRTIGVAVSAAIVGAVVVSLGVAAFQGLPDPTLGVAPAAVSGDPLPPASAAPPSRDPAIGATAPDVVGQTVDGEDVRLGATGTPQAVVFMAHWCPHCQQEAPLIADWVDRGLLAEGVELVAVSTLHDPARPNWPPDEWVAREGFPGAVLIDPDEAIARAWGLEGTPMWTFVAADGTVVARQAGQLSAARFAQMTALAAQG